MSYSILIKRHATFVMSSIPHNYESSVVLKCKAFLLSTLHVPELLPKLFPAKTFSMLNYWNSCTKLETDCSNEGKFFHPGVNSLLGKGGISYRGKVCLFF